MTTEQVQGTQRKERPPEVRLSSDNYNGIERYAVTVPFNGTALRHVFTEDYSVAVVLGRRNSPSYKGGQN